MKKTTYRESYTIGNTDVFLYGMNKPLIARWSNNIVSCESLKDSYVIAIDRAGNVIWKAEYGNKPTIKWERVAFVEIFSAYPEGGGRRDIYCRSTNDLNVWLKHQHII